MAAVLLLLAAGGRSSRVSWEGSDAPVWDAACLRTAADAAGAGLWSWNVDTDEIAMDDRTHALWGVPRNGPYTFADLSARIVPPDRDRVRAASGPYQIDFRVRHDGDAVRWVSARVRGSDEGIVGRIMFAVFLDAPDRKEVEVDAEEEAVWGPDLVVPVGLIAGEALTNAPKHAFPGGRAGRVRVELRAIGEGLVRLLVEDDGAGMPAKRREGSLGLRLIEMFAKQVKAGPRWRPGAAAGDGRRDDQGQNATSRRL